LLSGGTEEASRAARRRYARCRGDARVRKRRVPQDARAAAPLVQQVQGRGLLLQRVPGVRPGSPPPRTTRRTRARVCSLTRPRTLSALLAPPCRQIVAWKAGHKRGCGAPEQGAAAELRRAVREAARAEAARAPAGPTTQQRRLLARLGELEAACDWRGVVALEHEALALARELRGTDPGLAGRIHGVLGHGFNSVGQYARARELYEQAMAIEEALGDRAGAARACGNLGNCYFSTGDYGRARELHEQHKAISEELGDREEVGIACGNLGNCYYSEGEYGRACKMHEQHRAISEELGDRMGVAKACGNLGNCYSSTGDYGRAS